MKRKKWKRQGDTRWYDKNPSERVFTINTPEELDGFAKLVNSGNSFNGKTIKLGANIELNNTTGWGNWTPEQLKLLKPWIPIGIGNNFFNGTFDGNNCLVEGIYIESKDDTQGLFGNLDSGGIIEKLRINFSYIKGCKFVGGLVGNNWGGEINNISFKGNVIGQEYVGGLAGLNNSRPVGTTGNLGGNGGTISVSNFKGKVEGEKYIGGLAGANAGVIINSYSTGEVDGQEYVGGLVGRNGSTGMIKGSYSANTVTGTENNIGGLAGENHGGKINACSATGEITGKNNVGGLVGKNHDSKNEINNKIQNTEIKVCYSTGKVNGTGKAVGGLVGCDNSNGKGISDSYYDKDTSGQIDTGKGEGKTTKDLEKLISDGTLPSRKQP